MGGWGILVQYSVIILDKIFISKKLVASWISDYKNLSRESINDKYIVSESCPSVESMAEHWNSSIAHYEQMYKKTWRPHLTVAEAKHVHI